MEHPDAPNEDFNLSTAEARRCSSWPSSIWRKIKGPECRCGSSTTSRSTYDVQRRVPATEKAKRVLGFEATTTLDQMLDEVIPWITAAIEAGTI